MFEHYEIDEDDPSNFVPDWRDEAEDDSIELWQVVFIDEAAPCLWETIGVTEDELVDVD